MKVVINKCFGGFSISLAAAKFMAKRGNKQAKEEIKKFKKDQFQSADKIQFFGYGYSKKYKEEYSRTDPDLILAVETLKEKASGDLSNLKIVEIPDDISWEIDEYDGMEKIEEKHESWS